MLIRNRSHDIQPEPCISNSLGSNIAKTANGNIALFKVRGILKQGINSCRAEEYKHIETVQLTWLKVIAYSLVHLGI